MTDRIETAAKADEEKVTENGENSGASENISGADQPGGASATTAPDDIEAIIDLVIEKLGPAIAETIKSAVEAEAVAAFARIIRDPATAAQAREAAIEAARQAEEAAQAERNELAKAAKEKRDGEERAAAKAAREAAKKAKADYADAVECKLRAIDGVGFFEHGEDEAVLRFADGETFLPGHDRAVTLADFDVSRGRAMFKPRHAFNRDAPGGNAREAWVVVTRPGKKKAALRADLGSGLRVGGGASAVLPPEHLAF